MSGDQMPEGQGREAPKVRSVGRAGFAPRCGQARFANESLGGEKGARFFGEKAVHVRPILDRVARYQDAAVSREQDGRLRKARALVKTKIRASGNGANSPIASSRSAGRPPVMSALGSAQSVAP